MRKNRHVSSQAKDKLKKLSTGVKEYFTEMVAKYQEKANWGSLATILTGIIALEAFRSIGSAIAAYQGQTRIYTLSNLFTFILGVAGIWEFLCLLSEMRAGRLVSAAGRWAGKLRKGFQEAPSWCKWGICVAMVVIVVLTVCGIKFLYYDRHTVECYASIEEIYGIPCGVGEPLSEEEQEQRAGYWKIEEYPNQHRLILTYEESYRHPEIMREYSSACSMQLFQTPARIEYLYEVDQDRFQACDQEGFLAAGENGYRTPLTISYYSSHGRLLLQLGRRKDDVFSVEHYASGEQPQLLNSTLLRIPDGQKAGNGLASQQIETLYNAQGLPEVRRLNQGTGNLYGVNGERYTYDHNRRLTSLCYLGGDGMPVCNKSGIMLITFKYDDDGYLSSVRYYSDEDGTEKTEGFFGVFCEKFSYDDFHKLTERRQLDRTENWSCDSNGVYRYEYKYNGNALEEEFYWGLNEAFALSKQCGSHSLRFETGLEKGKEYLSVFFHSEGTPERQMDSSRVTVVPLKSNMSAGDKHFRPAFHIQETSSGNISNWFTDWNAGAQESDRELTELEDKSRNKRKYASIQYIFHDSLLEMRYCDAAGNAVTNEHGYAVKKTEYDDQMRVVQETYGDENGSPCYITGGYTAVRYLYENDSDDRITGLAYLDIDGNRTYNTEVGYAWVSYEYTPQEKGEKTTRTYHDADDCLCYIPDRDYAIVEDLYNDNGFLIQELYKNADSAVTCRRDYMVAEILYEYADDGNLIRERYKDAQGQPVNREDTGYAVVYREYEAGSLSRIRYEGYEDGVLCAVPDRTTGAAAISFRYERGEKREEHYFDAAGLPALKRDIGCASIEYEYDGDGQLIAEYYYGTDGNLILRSDMGCAIVRYEYDNMGRRISWRYYGVEKEAVINTKYHCAGIDHVYGERGHWSEIAYIGLDDSLMNRDDYGIAVICKTYDDFGNLSGESYYDRDKNPAIRKDTGYAAYEDDYDSGHLTERRYLDTQGNLMRCKDGGYAVLQYEYNDLGQIIYYRFLDEVRNPVISREYHCACIEQRYDKHGQNDRIIYRGVDDAPLNRTDYGIAEICRQYDEFGNIAKEFYKDADGLPAVRREYGYASCENVYENGRFTEGRYFDADYKPVLRSDTGYAVIRLTYDAYGQELSKYYYGTAGEPVICTDYHCAGFEFGYDRMGNQTEIRYIGLDDSLMNRRDCGVAKIDREYDALGNLTYERYFDVENNPAAWREYGYASYQYIYENGHLTEKRFYDTEGNPVLRKDTGYAVIKMEYGSNGKKAAEYYLDTSGDPVISTEYHCAGMTYEYDMKGNLEKIGYLGLSGEPVNREDLGCVYVCRKYDACGYLTEGTYLDADEKPVVRKGGYASYQCVYVNGNLEETSYFDTAGNLTLLQNFGYAIARSRYDEYGREISWMFYDENDVPTTSPYYQCAGFEYNYDKKNNQTDIRYIGLDGNLVNCRNSGVARASQTRDAQGKLTGETYSDREDSPTVRREGGYASYVDIYEDGKCIESRYFDFDGHLIQRKDTGYAMVQMEYDLYGQRIRERYFGVEEQPVLHTDLHCAGIENVYDEKGNKTEIRYLGLDGELINREETGIAKVCWEYDPQGQLVSEAWFDTSLQPVLHRKEGYASYRNFYDNGKLAETQYYDTAGNLILRKDLGCAIIRYQYDEFGRNTGCTYHGINREPVIHSVYCCAGMEYTYDEKGNQTSVQYLGPDGSLMDREDFGIAKIQKEYDRYGNLTAESYYDAEGALTLRRDCGYAACRKEYDDGRLTEIRYLDADGNLVSKEDVGYAMVRYEYNEYGQTSAEWYYGADGEPTKSLKDQCEGLWYTYDEHGRWNGTWYMGEDRNKATREDLGVDMEYRIYDRFGSLEWKLYYRSGDDGMQIAVPKGRNHAGEEYFYDEHENWIRRRYLNAEGTTVLCTETGYAVYERRYNDAGQIIAEIYYDEAGEFVNSVNGYAMIEYIYNASGNRTDWKYYDQSEVKERLETM